MMKSIRTFSNPLSEIEKERKERENNKSNSRNEIEKERLKRGVQKYKTQRQKRDEEDRRGADSSATPSVTTEQGSSKGEKLLKIYETMGGDPFAFFKDPPAPVFQSRDLIGEIKEKNESLRRSGAAQKMFPMYYEKIGAKQGKFVKAKCKLGKNKKTRIY